MLCTLAQLKARMGVAVSDDDALLTAIITGVSARLARACGRQTPDGAPCLEKTSVTEVLSAIDNDQRVLMLRAFPVVSITSIKEGLYNDFSDSDALVAGTSYHVELARGILHRIGGAWLRGPQTVQAIYVGGYTAAGDTPGAGETALPGDLVDAAVQQCQYLASRRDEMGATGIDAGQGGGVTWASAYKLLPDVAAVCETFRRRAV